MAATHDDDIDPDEAARFGEHPLEGGQTGAVDEAQDDARHESAPEPNDSDADESSMAAADDRPGGGER